MNHSILIFLVIMGYQIFYVRNPYISVLGGLFLVFLLWRRKRYRKQEELAEQKKIEDIFRDIAIPSIDYLSESQVHEEYVTVAVTFNNCSDYDYARENGVIAAFNEFVKRSIGRVFVPMAVST